MVGCIAIISDIHGNIEALNAVLSDLQHRPGDAILCAGDLVGYGPRPNEVIERLKALNIPIVMGNYDEAVGFKLPACGCHIDNPRQKQLSNHSLTWSIDHTTSENRAFLRSLPESLSLEMFGKKLFIIHASEDSISEYIYEFDTERIEQILDDTEEDIYIYGHTHLPFALEVNQKWLINAGSVGRPKDGDNRAGYVRVQITDNQVSVDINRVSYNIEEVVSDIKASGLDSYFGDFLRNSGIDQVGMQSTCTISNSIQAIHTYKTERQDDMEILHLTKNEFDKVTASGTVLVDFWAGWCTPCKMLTPVIEEIANELDDSVKIAKVDVDAEGELALRYNVMSIPTVILFKDGQEAQRFIGVQPKDVYLQALAHENN